MNEPQLFLEFITQSNQQQFILATLIETKGSTYRKSGAKKIITPTGGCIGLISGGCLEADIIQIALNLKTDSEQHTFDTTSDEDRLFGSTLGCQGILKIKFEKLSRYQLLQIIEEEFLQKQISIHVVGAGADIDPLEKLFHCLGWTAWFYTSNQELLQQRREKNWNALPITLPKMDWVFEAPQRSAVLLMSHSYPTDLDILSQLTDKQIQYIGILGPKQRRLKMLEDLETIYQKQWPENSSTILDGPMGLPGMGRGEVAIALSIVGRLQQVFFAGSE